LDGLQKQVHAHDLGELRAQPGDHLTGARLPLGLRLQLDEGRARVPRRGVVAAARERDEPAHVGIGQDNLVDGFLAATHREERNILRRLGEARQEPDVLLREEALRDDHVEIDRQRDGAGGDEQGGDAMAEDEDEPAIVERDDLANAYPDRLRDGALLGLAVGAEERRAHHRRDRQRDDGRDADGHRQGDRELAEEPTDDAAHEQKRDEDGQERDRDRDDREADLFRALDRRFVRRLAFFEVAHDVLRHDDRVVDDEAGRDRQRHQREVVEAVVEQPHRTERPDQRDRHGDAGDGGGPRRAEKDGHDEDDEAHGQEERVFDVGDGSADRGGAILRDGHLEGGGDHRAELGQDGLDALDRREDVRAWLAADDHHDRALGVEPGRRATVLDVVEDVGHIAQPHDGTVFFAEDEIAEGRGAEQLAIGRNREARVRPLEGPLRRVRRRSVQLGAHIRQREPVRGEFSWVDLHPHGRLLPAAHVDLSHARDLGDALRQDRVRHIVDVRERQGLRGQRQDHDRRVGGVHLSEARPRRHVRRQLATRRVDGRLHISRGRVHVPIELELQRDARRTEGADRRDLAHAGDATEAALERCGDRRRHRLGARPRQLPTHLNGGKVDSWEGCHRQSSVRDDASQNHRQRQQRRRDRAADEDRREVHPSAGSSGETCSVGPGGEAPSFGGGGFFPKRCASLSMYK
jgi:hypothetical protein